MRDADARARHQISALPKPDRNRMAAGGRVGLAELSEPFDVIVDDPDGYVADTAIVDLDLMRVNWFAGPALTAIRTPRRLDDEHGPFLSLIYIRSGEMHVDQNRATVSAGPGEIQLLDYAAPFGFGISDGFDGLVTYLPHDLLDSRGVPSRRLGGSRLPATRLGGLAASAVASILDPVGQSSAARRHVESAALDLSLALVCNEPDNELAPEEMEAGYRARAMAFIDANFRNSTLSVGDVAASLHVSTRYLYKLFEGHEETVYGRIRRRRVEEGLVLLADPTYAHLTIGQVAARCGFSGLAQFGRAVREMTGASPRDVRHGEGRDRQSSPLDLVSIVQAGAPPSDHRVAAPNMAR